jgi:energy-coupling factor transporter ATP-binding protein EcfA2
MPSHFQQTAAWTSRLQQLRPYEEPFFWWGPGWSQPNVVGAERLIAQDVVTAEAMAMLSLLIGQRSSCIVAAGPSGAGKTTLLTSLLAFLPRETRLVYLRGSYESFDFVRETNPATSALLVNELSPHLPVYLWGQGARTAFELALRGYQLLATAHATSIEELIYQLSSYPLRLPSALIAAAQLVVLLDAWYDQGTVRRQVRTIAWLQAAKHADGLTVYPLAMRENLASPLVVDHNAAVSLFAELGGNAASYAEYLSQRMNDLASNQ